MDQARRVSERERTNQIGTSDILSCPEQVEGSITLASAASAEAHKAHEKAMNEILDSIKPVAASEDD